MTQIERIRYSMETYYRYTENIKSDTITIKVTRDTFKAILDVLADAPKKEGAWIKTPFMDKYECIKCRNMYDKSLIIKAGMKFCPNCGAAMSGDQSCGVDMKGDSE